MRSESNDATSLDEALAGSLGSTSRRREKDAADTAYDAHPIDEPDDWGDPASFR